ncbi:13523_t:CDS:2, partial [Funneliformis geosporum]
SDILYVIISPDPSVSIIDSLSPAAWQRIERRLDNYQSSPAKMIDSLLGRSKQIIIIDRCINNAFSSCDLLTDEDVVKQEVTRYFQMATDTAHKNVPIDDDWLPFY